jgi:hypothetical protein
MGEVVTKYNKNRLLNFSRKIIEFMEILIGIDQVLLIVFLENSIYFFEKFFKI